MAEAGALAPLRSTPLTGTATLAAATAASATAHERNRSARLSSPPQQQQKPPQRQQRPKTTAMQPLREIVIDRPQDMKRALNAALDPPVESLLDQIRSRLFGRRQTSASSHRRRRRSSNRQRHSADDDDDDDSSATEFVDNVVVSAKYTVWNFFPRVLVAQLQKPSNVYFLFIAVLQSIKDVSNTHGVPTILLPLTIVCLCSAIKEALEDRERHRADAVMNSRRVLWLSDTGVWKHKQWGDVHVGDIVKVLNDETVPADLFMLATEELKDPEATDPPVLHNDKSSSSSAEPQHRSSSHVAYIETKSLDGETNLKIRTAIPLVAVVATRPSDLNALHCTIECEAPNNRIATFDGSLTLWLNAAQAATLGSQRSSAADHLQQSLDDVQTVRVPITAKQMVLRSCVLRNTRAIVGVAIFTGHETKVCCSNTVPVVKTSSVELHLSALILRVVCIQQLVCLVGALLGALWMVRQRDSLWYLDAHTVTTAGFPIRELVKLHVRYFIIMQNFVPISLNVSLEFVKYWQAYFIQQDLGMYDATTDTPALVRTSALNEDLGRVHHIFTDKTGTLTMNRMLFRFCTIASKHYGGDVVEAVASQAQLPSPRPASSSKASSEFVEFDPTELFADLRAGGRRADTIRRFLRHLALCHTLLPAKPFAEMCASATPAYSASSPDEQALVSAAAYCNVRFVHRTPSAMTLLEPCSSSAANDDALQTYKLLDVLEFDSDRKRMSVIVETPTGAIELLCKGADNVILERLAADDDDINVDAVDAQLTLYAESGMRTLCLAYKPIDRAEYKAWHDRFVAATSSMDELVKRRQGLPNAIDPLMHEIELDLRLLGVTAVQDKLQDGVPQTLERLQQTHMKVWTLTGDKMETAINIGYACALLSSRSDVQQVASDEFVAVAKALEDVARRQEQLSTTATAASTMFEANRRRRNQQQLQQSWRQRLSASLRTLIIGAAPPALPKRKTKTKTKTKKTRPHSRHTLRSNHSLGMYTSVSTRDHDDAVAVITDDNDDKTSCGGSDDERDALLRGQPLSRLVEQTSTARARPQPPQSIALVIDGKALEHALRPRLQPLFYHVTKRCASVICCRVSPKQKADVVDFVRRWEPASITLAIGDGANDVGMIQAAHVGVGISGQEGMQAVNASDYAISQFRFLERLLFVHGRWAYRRVAKLMSYMLYKNVTYVLTTFWFGCFCGFSGQPLILDVAAQSFNVLYTSLPLVLFAVFDQDVSSESAAQCPSLYALGQSNKLLTRRVFWPWIATGIWHSLVIFFVSAWGFQGDLSVSNGPRLHDVTTVSPTGQGDGLVTLGFVVFTNLVVVVNLKLVLETFLVTWPFVATIVASIALWFGVAVLLAAPSSRFDHAVGEMTFLLRVPAFYALCGLVVVLSLLRDVLWKLVRRLHFPSTYHILQEREKLQMTNSPRSIASEYREAMWSDVQVPSALDYARMLRQLPPFESAHESFLRSSPLAESLIARSSSGSHSSDLESARHVRSRASFHVSELDDLLESPSAGSGGCGSGGASGAALADSELVRHQYHGYAFSEDENVDSDVEAATVSSAKDKSSRALLPPVNNGAGIGRNESVVTGGRTFKKMLKSVRGPKNA